VASKSFSPGVEVKFSFEETPMNSPPSSSAAPCLKPNDISNLVNNCLADIPLGKFALYANERPLEKS
jgi:hypothetical protein